MGDVEVPLSGGVQSTASRVAAAMEPTIPEEPAYEQRRQGAASTRKSMVQSEGGTQQMTRTGKPKLVYSDIPSVKYPDVEIPTSKATLRRAVSPPRPTLPRKAHTRSWNATAKERNPLSACLTGMPSSRPDWLQHGYEHAAGQHSFSCSIDSSGMGVLRVASCCDSCSIAQGLVGQASMES